MAKLRPIDPNSNIIKISTKNSNRSKLITKILLGIWITQTIITIVYLGMN